MNKMKKIILGSIFAVATCLTFSLNVNVASADNGSGGENGGSGGLGVWYKVQGGTPGTSTIWNQFVARNVWGWTDDALYLEYGHMGESDLKACKTSEFIWWVGDSYTNSRWRTVGNGTNLAARANSSYLPSFDKMVAWMNGEGGSRRWSPNGSRTSVCSGSNPDMNITTETETKTGIEPKDTSSSVKIVGVHDSSTNLTPEKLSGYSKYSSENKNTWNSTHENQATDSITNAWGKWYDTLGKDSINNNSTNVQGQMNALKAKSDKLQSGDYVSHPKISMSTKNRKGFARGGVFTVSELHRNVSATLYSKQHQERTWTQKCTIKKKNGVVISTTCGNKKYGAWKVKNSSTSLDKTTSLTPYSFWQMINVRCNLNGLNAVANNINGFVKDSYKSGTGSSSGHTPIYKYSEKQSNDRPLGNSQQKNGTLKATSDDAFYESVGSCQTPTDPSTLECASAKQSGASNESKMNVNATGNKSNGTYGAQSTIDKKTVSSDTFSFYRDNAGHQVRTDLWYPIVTDGNSGITVDNKANPIKSRILFKTDGTPEDNQFGLRISATGSDVLTGSDIASNKGYSTDSQLNTVYPHGSWTSDPDLPQKMNIDWTWQPTVTNNVYSNIAGNGSGAQAGKTIDKSTIYASCAVRMNMTRAKGNDYNLTVINKLFDAPLTSLENFDNKANHFVEIKFVRATGDAQ